MSRSWPGSSEGFHKLAKFQDTERGGRENFSEGFTVKAGKCAGPILEVDDQKRHPWRNAGEFWEGAALDNIQIGPGAQFPKVIGVGDQSGGEFGFVLPPNQGQESADGLELAGQFKGTEPCLERAADVDGDILETRQPLGAVGFPEDVPVDRAKIERLQAFWPVADGRTRQGGDSAALSCVCGWTCL